MKMNEYVLNSKIIFFCILFLTAIVCVKKDDYSNPNINGSQSGIIVLNSNERENKFETDSTILKTDNEGNISGGDTRDWDFDKENYKEIQKYKYLFRRPFYMRDPIPANEGYPTNPTPAFDYNESFYYEIENNNVILKWFTARETNNKGFYVERAQKFSEDAALLWRSVGFINGNGDSYKEIKYKFIDRGLRNGIYKYRLKMVSFKDEVEYFYLSYEVFIISYLSGFEFYPAYPNPASFFVNVRFYLPEKDVVSLFFLNGKDTNYILNREPQQRGFYELNIDKRSWGFENELKRLYIDCESCNRKKNFGDIKFN